MYLLHGYHRQTVLEEEKENEKVNERSKDFGVVKVCNNNIYVISNTLYAVWPYNTWYTLYLTVIDLRSELRGIWLRCR